LISDKYEACVAFSNYLANTVIETAQGAVEVESETRPSGRFWLGRICSEDAVIARGMGERGERLEPCAIGMRLQIPQNTPQQIQATASVAIWGKKDAKQPWLKVSMPHLRFQVVLSGSQEKATLSPIDPEGLWQNSEISAVYALELDVEVKDARDDEYLEASFQLVNRSKSGSRRFRDKNFYEVKFEITDIETIPFEMESLPDSFRYERTVVGYGINCGVVKINERSFATSDAKEAVQNRPIYWNSDAEIPDLTFGRLSTDPMVSVRELYAAYQKWHESAWSEVAIRSRAEAGGWSPEMLDAALHELSQADDEKSRLLAGVQVLEKEESIRKAFQLMNEAMAIVAGRKLYDSWRPFQLGFILTNIAAFTDRDNDADIADVVWFATGGGKTETYLGLIIMAAFVDRLEGKLSGVTAWSRFPLRLLSLQQTQRFADAMAAAETVRLAHQIDGDQFSLGYLVGAGATPNRLKEEPEAWEPDIEDDTMPAKFQVLLRCPFCGDESIEMRFNRRLWRLEHTCNSQSCDWHDRCLPFYIVDEEIYRYLPTVLVGTLDKAATISMQAAMRGLVGPPHGQCATEGHGYTYAQRSKRPNGCLVPGCCAEVSDTPNYSFAPRLRLQDELHLLKDSLGAVDAHYEALYDGLSHDLSGHRPKILASSATLSGYEKQVDVLYRRVARVFPVPPPSPEDGFWTARSKELMRKYIPLAPRGVTLEYMIDNLVTILQRTIRNAVAKPEATASSLGIDPDLMPFLISVYGTDVVYGNTLRDLDAVNRSVETQINVPGAVNKESLTGRDDFEGIRETLSRLEHEEDEFLERLHLITASSMMSHGVDIDRLNVLCMLGLPLTTSEFIQATARVGRTWPGVVFVAFKIGRERDAAMYRLFDKYVEHGDRFVEAIPITRKSRRVLDRTLPGIMLSRILMVHEVDSNRSLVMIPALREYLRQQEVTAELEAETIARYLGIEGDLDVALMTDIHEWIELFFRNVEQPSSGARFSSDCSPSHSVMRSLRDVEEQVPIHLPLSR